MRRKILSGSVLIAAAVTALFSRRVECAEVALKWKLKEGQVLRQTGETEVTTTTQVGSSPQKVSQKFRFDTLLTVKSVDANGTAQVGQKCERLVLRLDLASGQSFEFDSSSRSEPKGPIWASMGPVLKALSTSEVSLELAATGKIERFKLPDELLHTLKSAPGAAGMGDLFSEESLQRMSSQWPALDGGPIQPGKTWTTHLLNELPVGTMATETTYTYVGTEQKEGRELHKLAMKTALSLEKKDPAQVEIRLKVNESSGSLYFDAAAGRFVEMEHRQTTTMQIGGAGGSIESVTASIFRSRCEEVSTAAK